MCIASNNEELKSVLSRINRAREKYKPENIKLLFIAEAPPEQTERFFYYEKVRDNDWLYLAIVKALCGTGTYDVAKMRLHKERILPILQQDGIYLMDVCPIPLRNGVSAEWCKNDFVQRLENEKSVSKAVTEIILIKANIYDCLYLELKNRNYKVQDMRIYFPSSGRQREFAEAMNNALQNIQYIQSEGMKGIKKLILKK